MLRLEDFQPRRPGPYEVLVRLRAASANPMSWKTRSGMMKRLTGQAFPYYDARKRQPSRRALRDEQITKLITEARQHPFRVRFGARKMWLYLRSQGHEVGRCTIERLMAANGWAGALRGKSPITTMASATDPRPPDLVDRDFTATRPNQLWVADFTYVPTWTGMVYVAFIFDVYSRIIVGWRANTQMTTELVLDTLEMAIFNRKRHGVPTLAGLVHHTDAGSQYTSFAFTQRLIDEGVDPSVGSVGDAYDNALAESQIGIYKTELIRPYGMLQANALQIGSASVAISLACGRAVHDHSAQIALR